MQKFTKPEMLFVENLSQLIQADGMPHTAGKIWALLVVSDSPLSLLALMSLLDISKNSADKNTRLLEILGIVERKSESSKQHDCFSIRPNPYTSLIENQIKRFETAKEVISEAKSTISNKHTHAKISEIDSIYTFYHASSKKLLSHLKSQSNLYRA